MPRLYTPVGVLCIFIAGICAGWIPSTIRMIILMTEVGKASSESVALKHAVFDSDINPDQTREIKERYNQYIKIDWSNLSELSKYQSKESRDKYMADNYNQK